MNRRDRDFDEELRHHRESLEAEYRAGGMSEDDARFAALVQCRPQPVPVLFPYRQGARPRRLSVRFLYR
jgi:hypothetical protein